MTPRRLFLAGITTAMLLTGPAFATSPSAWTRAAPAGQPIAAKSAPASASQPAAPAHRHRHATPQAYRSEAAAKSACGGAIVWHARDSRVVHGPHSHWWNNTKGGAFLCQKAALAAGLKLSRH